MTAGWCGNKGARPRTSLEVARRGKMILIESCLGSIPNYTMGTYHLQDEIHQ
jgi:hypothetical protein